jgi:membrane protein YqaA with SNARE-associated domain
MKDFSPHAIFSYNQVKKRLFVIVSALIFIFLLLFVLNYLLFFKNSDFFLVIWINSFLSHISSNIANTSVLGAFYTTLFGGLFFIFLPLEAVFITFLKENNSFIVILLYLIGLIISYTINYFIGYKLTDFSKKIITPKKFYKIKNYVNKYGALAIFLFNVFPLPSQPLSAILGVFKYNKARFYIFFILGQLVKYTVITIGYFYIT